MKITVKMPESEPEQKQFKIPSEKEHLFQVSDIFTYQDETGARLGLDPYTVSVKCEVVGGEEEGRTLLNRISLNPEWKGFFATRLFLKALGFQYKGEIEIDTDDFQGCQFYATVVHTEVNNGKVYANIGEYNFRKIVENKAPLNSKEEIEW
jgi:hypothetical protein